MNKGSFDADHAREIIAAQLAPVGAGATSVIPAGTTLRGLFLTPGGTAYVDLSRDEPGDRRWERSRRRYPHVSLDDADGHARESG